MATPDLDISLGRWFAALAENTPHRRALTFEGTTWTYRELQARIDQVAGALRAGGVCRGDRVGFLGLNQPTFFTTMFAAARLGAIFVPLNFRLTGPELAFMLEDAGRTPSMVDEPHRARHRRRARRPVHACLWRPTSPPRDGRPSTTSPQRPCRSVTRSRSARTTSPSSCTPRARQDARRGPCSPTGISGGTTRTACTQFDVLEGDVTWSPRRCSTSAASTSPRSSPGKRAAGRAPPHVRPGCAIADVATYSVTTMFGVPAMFLFMSQHPDFDGRRPHDRAHCSSCGGAPVPDAAHQGLQWRAASRSSRATA